MILREHWPGSHPYDALCMCCSNVMSRSLPKLLEMKDEMFL